MAKMGRPPLTFDKEKFESYCAIMCTEVEIAALLKMSVDTLERRVKEVYGQTFAEAYKTLSSGGKMSLRRAQFQAAEKGNVAMLIWLGKQLLGQVERGDSALSGEPPMRIHISGKPDKEDLNTEKNDNLEISKGKQ